MDDTEDFVARQLALFARQLTPSMVPEGATMRGSLPSDGHRAHPFEARPGHCYRMVAAGGATAEHLDLTLLGPDGTVVDSDRRGEPFPQIGSARPVCPPAGGRYTLDVHMVRGDGAYGVAIFRTP